MRPSYFVAAHWLLASVMGAQLPAPRPIGPPVAVASEPLGTVPSVRPLADGRVLVSDGANRQLLLFDSTLKNPKVILGPSGDPGTVFPGGSNSTQRSGALIAGHGDTTYFVDYTTSSILTLDGLGQPGKVVALPRSADTRYVALTALYGQPVMDAGGRLIYRRDLQPSVVAGRFAFPDSTQIVRADFNTRTLDTVVYVHVAPAAPRITSLTLADGSRQQLISPAPFDTSDDWVAYRDGSIAVIRWKDYHVDLVAPDHSVRPLPRTAWNWKRLDDDGKSAVVDSLKILYARADSEVASQFASRPNQSAGRANPPKTTFQVVPAAVSEIPDYAPPFIPRMAKLDADENIWVPERPSLEAKPTALIYDVIDRRGQIIDRVQVPAPYMVMAIGPGGSVYLAGFTQWTALSMPGPAIVNNPPLSPPVRFARAILPKKP